MATAFAPPPPAAISRVLATFDRATLAGFVAVAIDLLDIADGDTDAADQSWPEDLTARRSVARGHGDQREDAEDTSDDDMCAAGDDGCGRFQWGGQAGGLRVFGSEHDYLEHAPTLHYGVDQSEPFKIGELAAADTMFAGADR